MQSGPGVIAAMKQPSQPGWPACTSVRVLPPTGAPTTQPAGDPPPAAGAAPIHPPEFVTPPPWNFIDPVDWVSPGLLTDHECAKASATSPATEAELAVSWIVN